MKTEGKTREIEQEKEAQVIYENYIQRAKVALARSESNTDSGIYARGGRRYVILDFGHKLYAVYRIRRGRLDRLYQWPKELAN
jgi:hypothetical protein